MRIGLLLEKKLNNPKYQTMQKQHKCEGKTFTLKKLRTIISYSNLNAKVKECIEIR